MAGKVLRQPESSPSYLALMFAIDASKNMPTRRGRPYINLYDLIRQQIESKLDLDITNPDDLETAKNKDKISNECDVHITFPQTIAKTTLIRTSWLCMVWFYLSLTT